MIRIQKYLANIGVGSRREIEKLIVTQKVTLNGKTCELGSKITMGDIIFVNGKKIIIKEGDLNFSHKLLIYNKPLGEVCSRVDEKGRKTVFDNLPKLKHGKWINIGRLDINSSGLLLFTTDGDLANKYMHPSSQMEREYLVKVVGRVTKTKQEQLLTGVKLSDGLAKFKKMTPCKNAIDNKWYKVILCEGRNREVRRMFEFCDLMVSKLIRIRYDKIKLPKNLKNGQYIELKNI